MEEDTNLYESTRQTPWYQDTEWEAAQAAWKQEGDQDDPVKTGRFWQLMQKVDDALHRLDGYRAFDWFTNSEIRWRFCQWAWDDER